MHSSHPIHSDLLDPLKTSVTTALAPLPAEAPYRIIAANNPVNASDPYGFATNVIITQDYVPGLGWLGVTYASHSAIRVDNPKGSGPVLFDPAGSVYAPTDEFGGPVRGSGDYFEGSYANLSAYVAAQQKNGSAVQVYTVQTTAPDEAAIANRILGDTPPAYAGTPLLCATSCASALQDIGPFQNLGLFQTPGSLGSYTSSLTPAPSQQTFPAAQPQPSSSEIGSPIDAAAAGGYLIYPNKPNTNMTQSVYSK